jgi:hypothetical protein
MLEVQNNYSHPIGAHQLTVGAKLELYRLANRFTESAFGVYTFRSLDSLERGQPDTYRVSGDLGGGVEANFRAGQYSAYAQDQWQLTPNVSLTYGVRADVPVVNDRPAYTPVVDTLYGRRTDRLPSGGLQVSPRLGFNWNVTGDRRNQLRGGVGVFVGRPPFVWVGNAFLNSGSGLGFLNCSPSAAAPGLPPQFSADPNGQPAYCLRQRAGAPAQTPPDTVRLGGRGVVGPVNLLDEKLRYPQVLRTSLAFDRLLSGGVVATVEGLYTRGLNNFFYINRNLIGPRGVDRNGRVIYGDTIRSTGVSNPALVSTRFNEVIDATNQSSDYSYSITGQLRKRFTDAVEFQGAYTYGRAYDVQSLIATRAISNWRFGRSLSGDHLARTRSVSIYDQPHRVVVSGTGRAPWRRFATDFSVVYIGQSGTPIDYVYGGFGGRGDLNADGVQGNDLVYIPTDAADPAQIRFRDITDARGVVLATAAQQAEAFDAFVDGAECLRAQRGRIAERNSCRNPWRNVLNVSLRQSLPTARGQNLSLQAEVFNFLNLLNSGWGLQRSANDLTSQVSLLDHVGQTAGALNGSAGSQGVFQFNPATRRYTSENLASNWQLQLSLRYSF